MMAQGWSVDPESHVPQFFVLRRSTLRPPPSVAVFGIIQATKWTHADTPWTAQRGNWRTHDVRPCFPFGDPCGHPEHSKFV